MAQQLGTARRRPRWVGKFTSSGSALGHCVSPLVSGIVIGFNVNRHPSEWWLSPAFLILAAARVLRGVASAVALRRRPEWAYVRPATRRWEPGELRPVGWLGGCVAAVSVLLFALNAWTGIGGATLRILSRVALLVGVLAVLAVVVLRPDPVAPSATPPTTEPGRTTDSRTTDSRTSRH